MRAAVAATGLIDGAWVLVTAADGAAIGEGVEVVAGGGDAADDPLLALEGRDHVGEGGDVRGVAHAVAAEDEGVLRKVC